MMPKSPNRGNRMKRALMSTRVLIFIISVALLVDSVASISYADDALVLPKGTWRFWLDGIFYLPITKRFNKNGDTEDVAKDFNTTIDSSLLPLLGAFGPGANVGSTVTSFKWDIKVVTFQPAYGVTDKLTVGMNIPYWWIKNRVNFRLDTTNATVFKNPGFACGAPLCPAGTPGNQPVTTQDIQDALGPGLTIGGVLIPGTGFGIKPIQTFEKNGFGDIEAGGRYQYFQSDTWRLAFTGGVRFPTGQVDDPDNLVDRGLGTGAYALLFRFGQDFVHQKPGIAAQLGVPEPGSFTVNTTFRYDLFLPDTHPLRVCSIHEPICGTKATVHRKYGDIVEAEISGNIGLPLTGLFFTPLYKYGHAFKDHHTGSPGPDYGALNTETDFDEHIYKVGLTYSTIPMFLENRFPLPLLATITYRDRFAGNNNLFKSQFIEFTIAAFF